MERDDESQVGSTGSPTTSGMDRAESWWPFAPPKENDALTVFGLGALENAIRETALPLLQKVGCFCKNCVRREPGAQSRRVGLFRRKKGVETADARSQLVTWSDRSRFKATIGAIYSQSFLVFPVVILRFHMQRDLSVLAAGRAAIMLHFAKLVFP